MKNLKEQLVDYLVKNGKKENVSYRKLYDTFPFDGSNLTNKQKGDRVRSVWKKVKKQSNYHSFSKIVTKDSFNKDNVPEIIMEPKKAEHPTTQGQYLILGCVHAPFVNKSLWDSLCIYANNNKNKIKGLILNGDFLDLNALSSHDKGRMPLKGWSLGREYKEAKDLLKQLTDNLNPDIYKAFLFGNHEDRFNRYMSLPDNKRLDGALPSPTKGLQLDNTWNVFTDWKNDEIHLGDLSIIHGEFFSVHLCKKYLDTFKKNMLFCHSHRQQLYREGSHVAYNIGCMLDVNHPVFSYASKAMKKTWANAFAIATLDNHNTTTVELVTWNKDHFYYGGNKY